MYVVVYYVFVAAFPGECVFVCACAGIRFVVVVCIHPPLYRLCMYMSIRYVIWENESVSNRFCVVSLCI